MKTKMYIAYGSNMDLEQMQRRCPEAELLGTGRLENWRLMFKGSKTGAYATIEREKGQNVPILLWRITEMDEERLDHYEGFPTFYYKHTIQVVKTDADGKPCGTTRGMAYIMHEERKLGIPSMEYFDILHRATAASASTGRFSKKPTDTHGSGGARRKAETENTV